MDIYKERSQMVLLKDEEIESMVKKYKSDYQLYRYGVKVESQEWTEIVMHTLETEPEK
jgi:hypothetical protein